MGKPNLKKISQIKITKTKTHGRRTDQTFIKAQTHSLGDKPKTVPGHDSPSEKLQSVMHRHSSPR